MLSNCLIGCENPFSKTNAFQICTTEHYKLYKTSDKKSKLLVLFPDLGGGVQSIEQNFQILDEDNVKKVSIVMMNFNHHLFLTNADQIFLTALLDRIIKEHNLSPQELIIGGFSSGGIVSSLWGQHLLETHHPVKPKKIFLIDTPLDLVDLFKNVTNVDSTSHAVSLEEAAYIERYLEEAFNTKDSLLQKISSISPVRLDKLTCKNIEQLKDIDLRLYTEPDSVWWKKQRGFDFNETDSYQVLRFAAIAKKLGWNKIELIQTMHKGHRANGQQHPHSWSIVDTKELMQWILEE